MVRLIALELLVATAGIVFLVLVVAFPLLLIAVPPIALVAIYWKTKGR